MKVLDKLIINPEKVLKTDELILLRGGSDDVTSFWCKTSQQELGCFTLPFCNQEAAIIVCRDILGGDTIAYTCGNSSSGCSYLY